MKAEYVSVWDDGFEVVSDCEYDPQTKRCSDIGGDSDIDPDSLECLINEFVRLADGTELTEADGVIFEYREDEKPVYPPQGLRTESIRVSDSVAITVSQDLVVHRQWFQLEPFPDHWLLTVKEEIASKTKSRIEIIDCAIKKEDKNEG